MRNDTATCPDSDPPADYRIGPARTCYRHARRYWHDTGVHIAFGLVALVAVAVGMAALARRMGMAEPLLLTVAGIAASYVPFVPQITVNPEIVLLGLLPPLVYTAAISTSLIEFRPKKLSIV